MHFKSKARSPMKNVEKSIESEDNIFAAIELNLGKLQHIPRNGGKGHSQPGGAFPRAPWGIFVFALR